MTSTRGDRCDSDGEQPGERVPAPALPARVRGWDISLPPGDGGSSVPRPTPTQQAVEKIADLPRDTRSYDYFHSKDPGKRPIEAHIGRYQSKLYWPARLHGHTQLVGLELDSKTRGRA
jgi:hypothetical protein